MTNLTATPASPRNFPSRRAWLAALLTACALLAPAARAQFDSPFSLVDLARPAGVYHGSAMNSVWFNSWVAQNGISNFGILDTSLAPASVFLSQSTSSQAYSVRLSTMMFDDYAVSFHWEGTTAEGGTFGYETTDSVYHPLEGLGSSGDVTFFTQNSGAIAFIVTGSAGQNSTLNISNFSAVAIPEPGTTGLIAGACALGFLALTARKRRGRA